MIDHAVSKEIMDDFDEANRCISVKAKKPTVTICRRVLQNSCALKDANPNADLYKQIDKIANKRIINPSMKDIAQTIRVIGNWSVHPQNDPRRDVTEEDV